MEIHFRLLAQLTLTLPLVLLSAGCQTIEQQSPRPKVIVDGQQPTPELLAEVRSRPNPQPPTGPPVADATAPVAATSQVPPPSQPTLEPHSSRRMERRPIETPLIHPSDHPERPIVQATYPPPSVSQSGNPNGPTLSLDNLTLPAGEPKREPENPERFPVEPAHRNNIISIGEHQKAESHGTSTPAPGARSLPMLKPKKTAPHSIPDLKKRVRLEAISMDIKGHAVAILEIDNSETFIATPGGTFVLESDSGNHSVIVESVGKQLVELRNEATNEVLRIR